MRASTHYYEPLIESAHLGSGKSAPVGFEYYIGLPGVEGNNTHRVGTYTGVGFRRVLIGYSTHDRCRSGQGSRMVWLKCTTYVECKSIRIAVSAVMDGWEGCCRAVLVFFQKGFRKEMAFEMF